MELQRRSSSLRSQHSPRNRRNVSPSVHHPNQRANLMKRKDAEMVKRSMAAMKGWATRRKKQGTLTYNFGIRTGLHNCGIAFIGGISEKEPDKFYPRLVGDEG